MGWNYQTSQPQLNELGEHLEALVFSDRVLMAIDGSTTCTGVAFIRETDGAYCGSVAFKRDKAQGETPVEYKVALKRALLGIFRANKALRYVTYEEPFIEYANAAKNLLMLRTMVEELIAETKPELDYIDYIEVSNGKWKKAFLEPDKVPAGTDAQKEAIKARVLASLPFLAGVTQDECDAIGLGYTSAKQIASGAKDELKSKKKVRPFAYSIEFYGGDSDEYVLDDIIRTTKAPKKVLENGIGIRAIKQYRQLDELVYETIGDSDTLQIIRLPAHKCGNLSLKYRIGHLTDEFAYLYAVVWRKSRKAG